MAVFKLKDRWVSKRWQRYTCDATCIRSIFSPNALDFTIWISTLRAKENATCGCSASITACHPFFVNNYILNSVQIRLVSRLQTGWL